MRKYFLLVSLSLQLLSFKAFSQDDSYVQVGEFGITGGAAHYFGDLNHQGYLDHPYFSLGAYYRKQFTNYTAIRLAAHYCKLGYSDSYSNNYYQYRRNLSFESNIYEVTLQGDFNFFRYNPTDPNFSFTPYLTFGIGVFSYDPYTYYNGDKVYLRSLHTEGQTFYKGRKEYGNSAVCFPIGFGIKYAVSGKVNLTVEGAYRFTTTDYIDDVSTTYIGIQNFPAGYSNLGIQLQDRSYETGPLIGTEGKQRGWSKQKDQYMILEIGLSFNISSYACPSD